MRILVISNVYPPLSLGGYEQLCFGAVNELRARGHEVRVLTSTWGTERAGAWDPTSEPHVHRALTLETPDFHHPRPVGFWRKNFREWRALRVFHRHLADFRPEVVFFWNMGNLTRSLIQSAQRPDRPFATAFYLSDDWLLHKPLDGWLERRPSSPVRRIAKRALSPVLGLFPVLAGGTIRVAHASFVSRALLQQHLDAGIPLVEPRVIYNRVPVERFLGPHHRPTTGPVRVLYLGQVLPHKGVHTAVEAMGILASDPDAPAVTLRIVGPGAQSYVDRLKRKIARLHIEDRVKIDPPVDRDGVVELLRSHHILVFPSIWAEPFSVVMMEAMATGIAIASTPTGGTAEILEDGVNAILFPKEDPAACARANRALASDPSLRERLGARARALVTERFRESQMVDEIEDLLRDAVGAAGAGGTGVGTDE